MKLKVVEKNKTGLNNVVLSTLFNIDNNSTERFNFSLIMCTPCLASQCTKKRHSSPENSHLRIQKLLLNSLTNTQY